MDNVAEEDPLPSTFCVQIDKGALTPAPQTGSFLEWSIITDLTEVDGLEIDKAELVPEDQEDRPA